MKGLFTKTHQLVVIGQMSFDIMYSEIIIFLVLGNNNFSVFAVKALHELSRVFQAVESPNDVICNFFLNACVHIEAAVRVKHVTIVYRWCRRS